MNRLVNFAVPTSSRLLADSHSPFAGLVGIASFDDMKTQHCYSKHKHCNGSFCSLEIDRLVPEWARLFKSLKKDISDDYRCSDDPDDSTPGMTVTIGFTPSTDDKGYSWHYQTGDNSYTGGAYGHAHWAVISLYRRSDSRSLAKDCADEIAESVACGSCETVNS